MRGRIALRLILAVLFANAEPASAWDPFANDGDVAPSPAPTDPAPFVVPEGLYLVTDVYTGNAVTTSGNTTTYTTTTAHDTASAVQDLVAGDGERRLYRTFGNSVKRQQEVAVPRFDGTSYVASRVLVLWVKKQARGSAAGSGIFSSVALAAATPSAAGSSCTGACR
jgi:hypothetical protein